VSKFWAVLTNDVETLNNYAGHPETEKLHPWTNPFFIATGISILNYSTNIFDLVRDGTVQVHIADITSLSPQTVHLSHGERLHADLLVYCTGWVLSPNLAFQTSNRDLGVPHIASSSSPPSSPTNTALLSRADHEIFTRFPRLKDQPTRSDHAPLKALSSTSGVITAPDEITQPYNLYRFLVPPAFTDTRDIVFAGCQMTVTTPMVAQVQALWVTAYFNGQLALPSDSEVLYSATLHNRFGKWRYPSGYADKFPETVFDAVPYLDMLLRDLGLPCHRKKGAFSEIFQPYGLEDYKGVVGEWLAKEKGGVGTVGTVEMVGKVRVD
jgi:hypothetical protein